MVSPLCVYRLAATRYISVVTGAALIKILLKHGLRRDQSPLLCDVSNEPITGKYHYTIRSKGMSKVF